MNRMDQEITTVSGKFYRMTTSWSCGEENSMMVLQPRPKISVQKSKYRP
jgi:hypothetical protein